MKKFLSVLLGVIGALAITLIVSSCAVKPKYLVEETLKEEAQKEINARQQEWNWKNHKGNYFANRCIKNRTYYWELEKNSRKS